MGRLAKYFQGGLSLPAMMKMTGKEILEWYDIYVHQIAEDSIAKKRAEAKKPMITGAPLKKMVEKLIKEWEGSEDNG